MDQGIIDAIMKVLVEARLFFEQSRSKIWVADFSKGAMNRRGMRRLPQIALQQALDMELEREIEALETAIKHDAQTFPNFFKERCRVRAIDNEGSLLSFLTATENQSKCNQIYFQIAEIVFQPKTMGDLVAILLPDVTCMFEFEFYRTSLSDPFDYKHVRIELVERPVSFLIRPPQMEAFDELVTEGIHLLDTQNIARFPFSMHQTLYATLQKTHPKLALTLYRHNPALEILKNEIVMVGENRQTPIQAIFAFMNELRLGGSFITKEPIASIRAQRVFTDFLCYLNSLPVSFKEALLSLKSLNGKRMRSIIDDLLEENCVEVASGHLEEIIENPNNRAVLYQPLYKTQQLPEENKFHEQQVLEIEDKYKKGTVLMTKKIDQFVLPEQVWSAIFSSLVIDSAFMLVNLLSEIRTLALYPIVLKYAQISLSFTELAFLIKFDEEGTQFTFERERLSIFNQALADNAERFGGVDALIDFAVDANPQLIPLLLDTLPAAHRLVILTARTWTHGQRLIHAALKHVDSFAYVWQLIPPEKRMETMLETNAFGSTVLSWLAEQSPLLQSQMMAQLPDDDRKMLEAQIQQLLTAWQEGTLVAAMKENLSLVVIRSKQELSDCLHLIPMVFYSTLFQCAQIHFHEFTEDNIADNVFLSKGRWPAYYEAMLDNPERFGCSVETLFFEAINEKRAEFIMAAFKRFSASECLTLLKSETWGGNQTLLHAVLRVPACVPHVLSFIPSEDRLAVVFEENSRGESVLQSLFHGSSADSVVNILESILPSQLSTLASKQDSKGNTLLHYAVHNLVIMQTILRLCDKADCLAGLRLRNNAGNTVLDNVKYITFTSFLDVILQFIPEEERLSYLFDPDLKGETVMDKIVYDTCFPENGSVASVWRWLTDAQFFAVLNRFNKNGTTLLHLIVAFPQRLEMTLMRIPKDQRNQFLEAKNMQGKTVIECASANEESRQIMMQMLSTNDGALSSHRFFNNAARSTDETPVLPLTPQALHVSSSSSLS